MKRLSIWALLLVLQVPIFGGRLQAQEHEAAVLLLNIQKLNQLREILDKMYEGYTLVSQGYNKIKTITSGSFQLHDLFLDALYMVNPEVKKYRRVADIIDYQLRMVREYKAAYKRFQRSGAFTPEKLDYLYNVYNKLIQDSLHNLDELLMVITARQLRMTDDERIAAIDRIYKDVEKKLLFLREFNNQQTMLAIEKNREQSEIESIRRYHGLEKK